MHLNSVNMIRLLRAESSLTETPEIRLGAKLNTSADGCKDWPNRVKEVDFQALAAGCVRYMRLGRQQKMMRICE